MSMCGDLLSSSPAACSVVLQVARGPTKHRYWRPAAFDAASCDDKELQKQGIGALSAFPSPVGVRSARSTRQRPPLQTAAGATNPMERLGMLSGIS